MTDNDNVDPRDVPGGLVMLNVFAAIAAERDRQHAKFGNPDHTPAKWMVILGEEFGELCKEVSESGGDHFSAEALAGTCSPDSLQRQYDEVVQVAAVAVWYAEKVRKALDLQQEMGNMLERYMEDE